MTNKQSLALAIVTGFFKEHDRLPSTRELATALNVRQSSAVSFLTALVKKGQLEKDGRYCRFSRS